MHTAINLGAARADLEALAIAEGMRVQTPVWSLFRSVSGTQSPIYFSNVSGFTLAGVFDDGSPAPEDDMVELPTLTIAPKMRGKKYRWTRLGQHQDQYNLVAESAKAAGRSLTKRKERDATDVLLNDAFTDTTFCATGDPLISDSHTINGLNFDNLYAATALSLTSLQEMITMLRTQLDPRGEKMPYTGGVTVLTGPEQEFDLETIIASRQRPGTADNDENVVRSRLRSVIADYADASSTAYILMANDPNERYARRYDHLADETREFLTGAEGHVEFVHQAAYGFGADLPYGFVGSQGA